jgi:hypothetical protein
LPETTGLASCLSVGDGYAFTSIVYRVVQGGVNNQREFFILWWNGVTTPWQPDANLLAKHGHWISLLEDAMASNFRVTIGHPEDSAVVTSVQVGAPLSF